MRSAVYALGLAVALAHAGCAPIIISDALSTSSRNAANRDQFTQKYQGANLARREQGLAPLDSCSEMYWFNPWMAIKGKPCAARVHRFENGDSTALNPPGMVMARTVPVVPDSIQKIYDKMEHNHPHRYLYR